VKKDEFDLCCKTCGRFKFLTCIYRALLMMAYQNYICLWTFYIYINLKGRCNKIRAKKTDKEM